MSETQRWDFNPMEDYGPRSYAFVDADNVKGSLEKRLKSKGFSDHDVAQLPIGTLIRIPHHVNRWYIYSSVRNHDEVPEWLKAERSKNKTVFRATRLRVSEKRRKQEGVDVQLAIDAMQAAFKGQMEHCFIYSDDGDLLPLVNALVGEGIFTTVVGFGNPMLSEVAASLRDSSDQYLQVDDHLISSIYSSQFGPIGQDLDPISKIEFVEQRSKLRHRDKEYSIGLCTDGTLALEMQNPRAKKVVTKVFSDERCATGWLNLNGDEFPPS